VGKIILAEKPDVARRIVKALFGSRFKEIEFKKGIKIYVANDSNDVVYVVSASGHLYNLDFLEEYNKGWRYPVLPPINHYRYVPINDKQPFLDAIKYVLNQINDPEIIVATDLDRRGSYIAMQILESLAKITLNSPKIKRMEFNSLTEDELRFAYRNLKPMDLSRAYAGWSQDRLDLLWGANLTRALTWAYRRAGGKDKKIMSAGRVQTPILKLVYDRIKEIENFKPQKFYTVKAIFQTSKGEQFEATLTLNNETRIFEKDKAEKYAKIAREIGLGIADVKTRLEYVKPPTPFSISDLQSEAQRLYGFEPTKTKALAQSLYEKALISYPRSGSTMFDTSIGKHDKEYFKKILYSLASYKPELVKFVQQTTTFIPRQGDKFDGAHPPIHAVRAIGDMRLSQDEIKIYELVFRRTLAILSPDAHVKRILITINVNNLQFKADGNVILEPGWLKVYPYSKIREELLPDITSNEKLRIVDVKIKEDETKPPPHYTQSSLIKMMEKLGLGTPATRDEEVRILLQRGYITGKSKLVITPLGRAVVEALINKVPEITTPDMTANMEKLLDLIENGKLDPKTFYLMTIKEVSRALEKFKGYERQIGDTLVKSSLIKPVSKNISRSRNVKKKYYKGPSFNDYLID
jgi:DNA topoisomerase-1